MTGRRLKTHVHYRGQVYGPDAPPPADVAEKITNPKVWADEDAGEPEPGAAGRPAVSTSASPKAAAPAAAKGAGAPKKV